MGKKPMDYLDKIANKEPATAVGILVELCRFKDGRIEELKEELKQEIMAGRVKKEFEG
jgi:hypothetical protein